MIYRFIAQAEKRKKKLKTPSESPPHPKVPAESGPEDDALNRDVPSPPPAPIFKESSSKAAGATVTAKQHAVKERSAGVEAGVIRPKPRGSKPKTATVEKKPSTNGSAAGKRCVSAAVVQGRTTAAHCFASSSRGPIQCFSFLAFYFCCLEIKFCANVRMASAGVSYRHSDK